jgi:hypothetical protein
MSLMKWSTSGVLKLGLAAVCAGSLLSGTAYAVPTESFILNTSADVTVPAGGAGTITVTQIDANDVSVLVTLAANVLFVNSGGPHTPFAFNISGSAPLRRHRMRACHDLAVFYPDLRDGFRHAIWNFQSRNLIQRQRRRRGARKCRAARLHD